MPNPMTAEFVMEMKQTKRARGNLRKSVMHPSKIDESLSSAVMEDPHVQKGGTGDALPGDRCVIV